MTLRERFRRARDGWTGKAAPPALAQPVTGRHEGGWWPMVREPYTGAWQRNDEMQMPTLLNNPTVFACVTQISQDIGKLPATLKQDNGAGVWTTVQNSAYSPVLRTPNHFQTAQQFRDAWLVSKLTRGNTYVLKERDARGVVRALYVLDPCFVWPLVAPDGAVYYRITPHRLVALDFGAPLFEPDGNREGSYVVPASEIIHDRFNCLTHQLVGLSPLFAAALPAYMAQTMGNNATNFWNNAARPSGILTAPAAISDDTAKRLKEYWDTNFAGDKAGRVAVLGDGLKFEAMTMTAVDAQLVEQLRFTAEQVCTAFHVPGFKVGVGSLPTHQNAEVLNQIYYTDCLQALIEAWENCMDAGLEVGTGYSVELDVNALLRMDQATRFKSYSDAIGGGWMAPNEARKREDMPPVAGGDTPYLQQQNWSLDALAQRPAPGTVTGGNTP